MDCLPIKKGPDHHELSWDPTQIFPDELCIEVFQYLSQKDLGCCSCVNRRWNRISSDASLPKPFESRSTNPFLYLKAMKSCFQLASPWERLSVDRPLKISTFNKKLVRLITQNNFIRVKHLWKNKPPSILLTSIVADLGLWKVKKGFFEKHLYEISRDNKKKYINISYPHNKINWELENPLFFVIDENIFGLSSNYGVIQIWDCLKGQCLHHWDFEDAFKSLRIEVKSVSYFCNRLIMDATSPFKEPIQLLFSLKEEVMIPHNLESMLQKTRFSFSQGIVLTNRIIFFRDGFIASFCFKQGVFDLSWSHALPKKYQMGAVNDRWIVLRKKKKFKILHTETGRFRGSILLTTKIAYLKLKDHFLCYTKSHSPYLFLRHLPSFKSTCVKLPVEKSFKKNSEINDIAFNDNQMVVMQQNDSHFRMISLVI